MFFLIVVQKLSSLFTSLLKPPIDERTTEVKVLSNVRVCNLSIYLKLLAIFSFEIFCMPRLASWEIRTFFLVIVVAVIVLLTSFFIANRGVQVMTTLPVVILCCVYCYKGRVL